MPKKSKKSVKPKTQPAAPPQPPVMPPGYPMYYPPEEEIDLMELWQVLVENKKLIGIITGTATALAVILALVLTPIYRAETLLVPVSKEQAGGLAALAGQFGGLADLAGINIGGGGSTEESIATLKSRELTKAFIKEEGLMPILFEDAWDENEKAWKKKWWNFSDDNDGPTAWDAYELFDKNIRSVNVDKKTNLVTVAIEWEDPELAAKWANKLVKRVNQERRQEAIEEAEKSIKYLEDQLQKTGVVEIQQSIYKLIEAQTKTKMVASTREEYAFKVIDKAVVPEEKAKPKRKLIVILGFILGGMAGVFTAFFRRFLQNQREKQNASSAAEK